MKRVVFASGKGGTGKTTMTAAAAHVAALEATIALADCDVEAANLPIALSAVTNTMLPFMGGSKAVIDPPACTGCGACASVCRFEAVAPPENAFAQRAFRIDPYACEGCGACVPACPAMAIRMETAVAGDVCAASTSIGPLAFGRLAPGEDLSGKLVTEVRGKADALASGSDAIVQLIDGPPGVGCPAIASITNTDLLIAVTEPTLSGAHDLRRLVVLARRLNVPVAIVLNKADLSEQGTRHIRAFAREEGLPIIAEVPFDPAFGQALARLVREGGNCLTEGPVAEAARAIWRYATRRLDQA